jgi:CRP-like cAMP-binding protein
MCTRDSRIAFDQTKKADEGRGSIFNPK